MKKLLALLVVVGLVGAAAWRASQPTAAVEINVVSITTGDVRLMVNGSSAGEVTPEQRAMVRGELPGTVEKVLRKRGDRINKGDVVVALDARDARARLAQAQAALEAAQVSVTSGKTRVEGVQKSLERMEELVKRGSAATAELDRVTLEHRAAQEMVLAGDAQVKQAAAALQSARIALTRMDLRAPFSGVLQDVLMTVGMQVTPGVPIFDIIDDSRLYVLVPVDEVDAPRIAVGLPAQVTFDSMRSLTVDGVVRAVAPAVGRDERLSRVLRVEIDLKNPPSLRVGMAATVSIVDRVVSGVQVVPTLSVQGRGVVRQVMLLADVGPDGVGRMQKRSIKVGVFNDDVTQVTDGLTPADLVLQSPNDPAAKEGARARPLRIAFPNGQEALTSGDGRPPQPAGVK